MWGEVVKMSLENFLPNKKVLASAVALATAGCASYAQQNVGHTPYGYLGVPGSGATVTVPDLRLDTGELVRYSRVTPSLVRELSAGRDSYREECSERGYRLFENRVIRFPDGSYCILDVCARNRRSIPVVNTGGDGGGQTTGGPNDPSASRGIGGDMSDNDSRGRGATVD